MGCTEKADEHSTDYFITMIFITMIFKKDGGGGRVKGGATIVRRYFVKTLLLFASQFGRKPESKSEFAVLKVHRGHFLKLPNTWVSGSIHLG